MHVVVQQYMPADPLRERELLRNDTGAYDFAIGDLVTLGGLTAVGVAGVPNFSAIPSSRYVDEVFRSVCPAAVPNDYEFSVIAYRKDIVTEPPVSWADFWRLATRYRGQALVTADQRATLGMALLRLGYSVNSVGSIPLQRAVQALQQLKPNLARPPWPSGHLLAAELAAGMAVVAQCSNRDATAAQAADDRVAAVIPEEGTVARMHCFVPLKDASRPEVVSAFLDFHLEPHTYARFVAALGNAGVESAAQPLIGAAVSRGMMRPPTRTQLARFEWVRYLGAGQAFQDAAWKDFLST